MRLFKTAILGVALISAGAMAANAADQSPAPRQQPPQVAANPGVPNVNGGEPGGNTGHWVWIPASPSPYTTNGATGIRTDNGQSYSKQGFGPKPN